MCLSFSHKENAWIIDSGCSHHMTGDKSNFTTLEPYDGGWVTFGNHKRKSKIIGLGTVGNQHLTIKNVYLVDGLTYNLLSVSKLCDTGYYVKFDTNGCYLVKSSNDEIIYTGIRDKNVYHL